MPVIVGIAVASILLFLFEWRHYGKFNNKQDILANLKRMKSLPLTWVIVFFLWRISLSPLYPSDFSVTRIIAIIATHGWKFVAAIAYLTNFLSLLLVLFRKPTQDTPKVGG